MADSLINFFIKYWPWICAVCAAASPTLIYLFKLYVDHQIAKSIENHKAALEEKTNILKTELSIYAHEQNVGLTRIDAQRSEAIQHIYNKIIDWYETFIELTKPNQPKHLPPEEIIKQYRKLSTQLVKEAEIVSIITLRMALFLSCEQNRTIAEYGEFMMDCSNKFYDSTFGEFNNTDTDPSQKLKTISDMLKNLQSDIKSKEFERIKMILLSEFRKIMKAEKEEGIP
ncbi:MAG: hypothetical protein GC154_21045 [bacterium]|nr:hypothetical protein [bacterium]